IAIERIRPRRIVEPRRAVPAMRLARLERLDEAAAHGEIRDRHAQAIAVTSGLELRDLALAGGLRGALPDQRPLELWVPIRRHVLLFGRELAGRCRRAIWHALRRTAC